MADEVKVTYSDRFRRMFQDRSNWIIAIGVIVVLILIAYLAMRYSGCADKSAEQLKAEQLKAELISAQLASEYNRGKIDGTASGMKAAGDLNAATNGALIATIDSLRVALEKCREGKMARVGTKAVRRRAVTAPAPKRHAALTTTPGQFAPPSGRGNTYNTSISTVKYTGGEDGDFWVTMDENGFLCYAFRQSMVGNTPASEYRLNTPNGPKFVQKDGIYFCPTNIRVSEEMLKKTFRWNIYAGTDKGYPEYFPHELIKWAIEETRGGIAGKITDDDLKKIGSLIPAVGKGQIAPNGVYVTAGDGQEYGGWEFKNTVLYKQK